MSRAREAVPSMVTFASLTCGVLAMIMTGEGNLRAGGGLILVGYVLDALDGIVARKLGATTDFGIQLDSIVDIVSFGAAPAVLMTEHLRQQELRGWTVVLPTLVYVMAGAFRLARFNLYAPLGKKSETVGLTISTAGAFITLAVLSDLGQASDVIPAQALPLLFLLAASLMASRIRLPEFNSMIRHRRASLAVLTTCLLLMLFAQPAVVWFAATGAYLCIGLARAAMRSRRDGQLAAGASRGAGTTGSAEL